MNPPAPFPAPSRALPTLGACLCLLAAACLALPLQAQPPENRVDARLMRQADVSATQIAFVYAGDIWIAPKSGGTAVRLSSPRGEESFPRFSPDGSAIAFSGNYDGNLDVYVVATAGGLPRRITHHGAPDRVVDWYPDGASILFATSRTSEKDRFNQLYKVPATGGLPEKLPMPYGEFASLSPDARFIAYTPISLDFRTWKRYRGGMAPDIWIFDLEKNAAENVTRNDADDSQPLWHQDTLFFLSDRAPDKKMNVWAYDTNKKKTRQITRFSEYDCHFPGLGPDHLVLENGGRLFLLNLATEDLAEVDIRVVTDRATLKPRLDNVSGLIHSAAVSPTGQRAVFEARGDLFTVPVEHGYTRNLSRTSGTAERYPAWSPDARWIAYFSDRSGEYELTLRPADGSGDEQTLSSLGPGFRYPPTWSPDSKKLVFLDQAMRIHLHDRDTKETRVIDNLLWAYHGELLAFRFAWSPDSRWLAYPGELENRNSAIVLYDTQASQRHQVTSGFYDDSWPAFDPDGKYLYYRTGRSFTPVYSDLDNSWIYPNTLQLAAVPLRRDVLSPLAPRNDDEPKDKDKDKDQDKENEKDEAKDEATEKDKGDTADDAEKDNAKPDETDDAGKDESKDATTDQKKGGDKKSKDKPKPVDIDLAGFEERTVLLPPKAGRFAELEAVSGKLIFRRLPAAGSSDEKNPVLFWDLEKREEKTIVDHVDWLQLSGDRKKLLVRKGSDYSIIEPKEGQKLDKKLATAALEATVDPVAEWKQLFNDAWRIERDFFYDPKLHGVDWPAMRERYGRLLEDAVTRWDVNYLLGEMIAELNASHTYRSGGDTENPSSRDVGYLGADFALENGAYRIRKIIKGSSWDLEVRSPLLQAGTNIHEGDYLLAVNGAPLDPTLDPWAAFQGLADKTVLLTVNSSPALTNAREVLVQTLGSEARLRNLAWIESNRRRVEEASNGRVGYVYVPDTGRNGQNELVRQVRGQIAREGLILDERFNSGGQIPDRFIELLNRPLNNFWGVRDGRDWAWPPVAHFGPKAMLINGWSGSGGDCFPFYFKEAKLGPLIGTRTWGGLIGITGTPQLLDGGSVTAPTFSIYNTKGEWIIEGYGVDPDIEVVDDPGLMASGRDPQLERAVEEVLKALKKHPPRKPNRPAYPSRAR